MTEARLDYTSIDSFYDGILKLTERGLTFRANPENLTIWLTGGY